MGAPPQNDDGAVAEIIALLEREQRLIGYELHDNLCQTLAGTSMILESIGRKVAASEPVSPEALAILNRIVETAITQTRALSHRFSPDKLNGAGLMTAFQDLTREHPHCEFVCEKAVFIPDHHVALGLYRVAQEALRNALQHSEAASIRLSLAKRDGQITLRVKDNGRGFTPPKPVQPGTGLALMHVRARSIGATLKTASTLGTGTLITLKTPPSTQTA